LSSQSEILNKVRAIKSADSLPPYVSPVSQSVDKMGSTDFLFELINQTKGQDGLKDIVLKNTLGELNNNININTMVSDLIKEVFFCYFDLIIPASATQNGDGFIINIADIDIVDMLSTDPNSPEGKYIYDGNDPQKSLNYLIYTAFSATEDNPVSYVKNDKTLFTLYYLDGNEFKLRLGAEYDGVKLSTWAEDYLQGVSFFNMPNFVAQLADIMTGAISIKTSKGSEAITQNVKLEKALGKLFGFCKPNSNNNNTSDNNGSANERVLEPITVSANAFLEDQENKRADTGNLFDFSADDILNIEDIANLRSQGKMRFATCGNFEMNTDTGDILKAFDELFVDAIKDETIGDNQVYDNEAVAPNINETATFLNDMLYNNVEPYINDADGNEQGSTSANDAVVNLPNMEMEFEMNVVKAIPFALTQQIISPQLMLLIKASSLIVGEEENSGVVTMETVVNKLGTFITQIGDQIWNVIQDKIFEILVKELQDVLSGLATKYITQRFSDYTAILSFIMNLINQLNLSASGCQSMLDVITRLLSLNYFGPAFPIPPPLVYAGGMLKPGLNQVSVVNDLKSQLADKGIETGAYMSDGTPNYMMAAMEIQTQVMVKHIKEDSKIDVMTIGPTGPTTGYAQMS